MDEFRLDALARRLSGRRSRRALLVGLAALGLAEGSQPADAKKRKRKKKPCVAATASLQAAINGAAPKSTVRLCAGIFPGLLTVDKDLTLIGAGAGRTTLSGGEAGTVVRVAAGRTVVVRGLTVTDGLGGVYNAGTLTLSGCVVRGNATRFGAGAYNAAGARLPLDATVVAGNDAINGGGGGIFNEGDLLVRNGSTIGSTNPDDGNVARFGGGLNNQGTATFTKGTKVVGNSINDASPGNGGGIYNNNAGVVNLATASIVGGNTNQGSPDNCAGPQPVANCRADA